MNALLYAFVPGEVDVEQSNPNTLVSVILTPEYFGRLGRAPSNPNCIGTINLRVDKAISVAVVPAVMAASIDPVYGAVNDGHAVCALCDTAPKLKSKLDPVVDPLVGTGAK